MTRSNLDTHAAAQGYCSNLAALWRNDPSLGLRVEHDDDLGPLPTGVPQPIEVKPTDGHFAYCVEGLAAARDLWQRTGREKGVSQIVCWIEDETSLRASLAGLDVAHCLGDARVRLFVGPGDVGRLDERLDGRTVLFAGGLTHFGESDGFRAFAAELDAFASRQRTNVVTAVEHGRRTAINVAGNLHRYASGRGIGHLAGLFQGRPGILVSAGPSLRRNISRLRDARDRGFVLVAVQTALKPLLAEGVEPHFVCSIDHSEISTRFMEGLPSGLRCTLVAEPKASAKVLDVWTSDPSRNVALLGNGFAESLLREMNLKRATLPPGATVAHLAFELIEHLGCSDLVMVGQDLGFADGLAYAPGTGYDDAWRPETGRFNTFEMKQWEHIARDRGALLRVPDYRGNPTYTERRLAAYLGQFEQMIARTPMRVIDATEGGVAKQGAEMMPLYAALDDLQRDGIAEAVPGLQAEGDRSDDIESCLIARRGETREIAAIAAKTIPLLDAIRQQPGDRDVVNSNVSQIDRIRRPLASDDAISRTYGLVTSLTQRTEHERVLADLRIEMAEADGGDETLVRQRRVERDLANVRAIAEAAADLEGLLNDLLQGQSASTLSTRRSGSSVGRAND